MTFPIENFNPLAAGLKHITQTAWPKRDGSERVTDRWQLETYIEGDSRVFVSVSLSEVSTLRCYLDFNPARVFDPHGTALAPVRSLPALTRHVIYEHLKELNLVPTFDDPIPGRRWLAPHPMSQVVVNELHVARDSVGLRDPAAYVHAVQCAEQPYAKIRRPGYSRRGRLQSFTVGNGSGEVCVYDKSTESADKKRKDQPQPGTLRVEVRLKEGWLKTFGLRTLDRVTADNTDAAFRERAAWSGVTRPVGGPGVILDQIDQIAGISGTTRAALKGYLLDRTLGRDSGLTRDKLREFDRMLAQYGMPSANLLDPGLGRLRRVDLGPGIEVYPSASGRVVARTPQSVRRA